MADLSPFSQKQNANIATSLELTVRPGQTSDGGTFIESWNGISILRRQALSHPDHDLWSDASGSCMGRRCLLEFRLDSVSVATCHPTRANCNQRTSPNCYSLCPLGDAMEGHNSKTQLRQRGSSDSHKLRVLLGLLFNACIEMHILLFSNIWL